MADIAGANIPGANIPGLAEVEYGPADFHLVRAGRFVLCAVSGAQIPLDRLTYWSAEYQEAYRGPAESTKAWLAHRAATE